MQAYLQSNFCRKFLLAFLIVPLVVAGTKGAALERSFLKEAFSVITILSFFLLIGQFFWARSNRSAVRELKMASVLKYHKFVGYTFVAVMLFHPLYIVIPRYFEAGVAPVDAFITMITTMNTGVVLGIIGWCLMLALCITSYWRDKLPMNYKSWRVLHGILAIFFILSGVWHAIDLGRHSTLVMSILLSLLSAGGILLLLKTYFFKKNKAVK